MILIQCRLRDLSFALSQIQRAIPQADYRITTPDSKGQAAKLKWDMRLDIRVPHPVSKHQVAQLKRELKREGHASVKA